MNNKRRAIGWIASLSIAGGLIYGCYLFYRPIEIIPPAGSISSVTITRIAIEYEIRVNESCKINDSPWTVELLEVKTDEDTCKLDLYNSSTNEHVTFWASPNQPIKEIKHIFGTQGFGVKSITEDLVTIVTLHCEYETK